MKEVEVVVKLPAGEDSTLWVPGKGYIVGKEPDGSLSVVAVIAEPLLPLCEAEEDSLKEPSSQDGETPGKSEQSPAGKPQK